MAIDYPNKRLYVTDFLNQRVQVFNSDTESPLTILNNLDSGTTFINPIDVAVDGNGNFFVADIGASQPLKKFDSTYVFLSAIGPAGVTAQGVWADTASVYFSTPNGQVLQYNGSTTIYAAAATYGNPGTLNSPNEIAKIGNFLYVADTNNLQIVKFNTNPPNPIPVTVLTNLLNPSGFRTDQAGNIYVVEDNSGNSPEYLDEFSSDFSVEFQCPLPALGMWCASVNDLGQVFVSPFNGSAVTLLQGCGTSALPTATPTLTSTATVTATSTSTKTVAVSPTVTLTATPTPTISATPTVLTATPTAPDGSCDQSYAYPDPVTGPSMKIHLHLCETAQVTILFYNTAGENIGQTVEAASQGPNDFTLQVSGWAYGIYYYLIQVNSASGTRRLKPQKFAIIH